MKIPKIVPVSLLESLEFQRGQDPKRAMGIGKFYDIWRNEHTKKPIVKICIYLTDSMGNKKRFVLFLNYEANWDGYSDSIWWNRGRLMGGWEGSAMGFATSNMGNKPVDFFSGDSDERTMWRDAEVFNREVIDPILSGNVKSGIRDIMEEWLEGDFEQMLREWFATGVMRVSKIEYTAL